MNSVVILLVLCSAVIHTYWNFVLKRAINSGADNILLYWLSEVFGVLMYSVAFIFLFRAHGISSNGVVLAAFCGLFLAGYVFFLSKSYQHADFSKVYPLAKITPLFTMFIGLLYLGESIKLAGLVGIVLIVLGVYTIHLNDLRNFFEPIKSLRHKGSIFALLTAIVSAGYGLFSKLGVKNENPFVFVYVAFAFTVLFYAPLLLFKTANIRSQVRQYKKEIIKIGICDMFGYSLVLIALSLSQLSYVFALRQMSIIFSVLLGIFVFNEGYGRTRIIASFILCAGIVMISIST